MKTRVIFYVCLTAFLFGTMEVACKVAGNGLDSFQITALRFFVGGVVLVPMAFAEKRANKTVITTKDLGYMLLLGIMCVPISMLFFQLSVENCNASTASVLISVNPVFTMIFAHFMAGEKMDRVKVISFAVAIVGLFFMIRPWDVQEGNTVAGIVYMLIAAVTFALYTVMGNKATAKVGVFVQTSISFILGSLVLMLVILIMGRPVIAGVADNLALLAYVGIFVTGVGYLSYFLAIKYSDATTGSIAFFIKPVIAPVIAAVVLHEQILWNMVVGIAIILTSSLINMTHTKKLMKEKNQQASR